MKRKEALKDLSQLETTAKAESLLPNIHMKMMTYQALIEHSKPLSIITATHLFGIIKLHCPCLQIAVFEI